MDAMSGMLASAWRTARDTMPWDVRLQYVEDAERYGVGFEQLRDWNRAFCQAMATRQRWVDCLLRDCFHEAFRRHYARDDWWNALAGSASRGMPSPLPTRNDGIRPAELSPRQAAIRLGVAHFGRIVGSPSLYKQSRTPLRTALPNFMGRRGELHSLFMQFTELHDLVSRDEPVYDRDLDLDLAVAEKLALAVSRDEAESIRRLAPVSEVLALHPGRVAVLAVA